MSSSTTATTSPKKRPLFEVSGGEVLGAGGLNDEIRQSSKRSRFSIDDLLRATEKEIPKQLLIPSGSEAEESNLHSPHSPTSTTRTDSPPTAQTSPLLLAEVECRLEGAELWAKFYDLGTEMIITKSGRFSYTHSFHMSLIKIICFDLLLRKFGSALQRYHE